MKLLRVLPWAKVVGDEPLDIDLEALEAAYPARTTSPNTVEFQSITLERRETPEREQVRKSLRASGIKNPYDPKDCLKIQLVAQKKHNKADAEEGAEWENLEHITLKAGQEFQIDLPSTETGHVAEHLQNLYALTFETIPDGLTEKVVLSGEFATQIVRPLLEQSPEKRAAALRVLSELDPNSVELAALQATHQRHRKTLTTFREQLDQQRWAERDWETFFRDNKWIFGQGLTYQLLSEIEDQATVGSAGRTGSGSQVADRMMATEGAHRFVVLLEVKKPQAELVAPYRSGAYKPGGDVVGGVAQLQAYCRRWDTVNARDPQNLDLEMMDTHTIDPKGILIVGNLASLDTWDKQTSFELFRRELHNPAIVTFDELCKRTEYIVEHEIKGGSA